MCGICIEIKARTTNIQLKSRYDCRSAQSRSPVHWGGVVLEPFCGSGSALLACEQLRRKCYAIELDPRYVQVIIGRWQRYTKRTAECLTRPEAVIIDV